MDISTALRGPELSMTKTQVDAFNKTLDNQRVSNPDLGKDDFLKILLTQLTHQDPTQPMEDKEFIAQMAQFSTLEQMTNMSSEFERLSSMLGMNQAQNLLGRIVEVVTDSGSVEGTVEEIAGRDNPQVLVNGTYYDYTQIAKVKRGE